MPRSPRRHPSRGTARDRGAAAVEFALVVPLLLLLVCGMVDFARAYNTRIALSEAAAEGARTLAVGSTVAQAKDQVTTVLRGFVLDPTAVSYTTTLTACVANATAPTKVELRFDYRPLTPLISRLFPTIPLKAAGSRTCFT